MDKQGQPYILHSMRVVLGCTTPEARVVAALHDVLEDTDETIDWPVPVPTSVIHALYVITRHREEPYETYIERVTADPLAREVKRSDLRDNLGRIDGLDPETQARLRPRYEAALARLSAYMENSRELRSHWFFSNFRWYRRWKGGHWEQWLFEACGYHEVGIKLPHCTRGTGLRPSGPARGTPLCEEYEHFS